MKAADEAVDADALKKLLVSQEKWNLDVYSVVTEQLSFDVRGNRSTIKSGLEAGYSVRFLADSRSSFVWGTNPSLERIASSVRHAGRMSELFSPSGASRDCLPGRIKMPSVPDTLDEGVAENPAEAAGSIFRQLETSSGRAGLLSTVMFLRHSRRILVNSNGCDASFEDTHITLGIKYVNDASRGFTLTSTDARTVDSIDFARLKETISQRLKTAQLPSRVPEQDYQVVISGNAAANFFENLLGKALSIRSVKSLGSFLAGKLGQQVASEQLTVYDDGLVASGVNSYPFDGDGYQKQRTLLMDRGTLCAFLYDAWYSERDNVKPTGSVSRENYSSMPVISTSNLQVVPGRFSLESFLAEHEMCAVIEEAEFQLDVETGDCYALVDFGRFTKDGRPVGLITGRYLRFNCAEAFRQIEEISIDHLSKPGFCTPSVLFAKGTVVVEN